MERELPLKVVWSEGMPLWPQHLQQLDRYHEQYITVRQSLSDPWSWGLVECELDSDALASGLVAIKRFVGALPDGAILSFGTGGASCPPSRPVQEHYRPEIGTVDVFVALPREREGVVNYAREEAGAGSSVASRFRVSSRTLPDLVGGGEPATVEFARPNVTLRLGSESRDDFECIKVAEVTRDATGRYQPVETFIPASMRVGASRQLLAELRRLHGGLVERDRLLARTSEPWRGAAGQGEAAVLLRLVINSWIPWLHHVCDAGDLHPRVVYLELLKLGGQLSMFRSSERPSFPRYDHADLRATFVPLIQQLFDMLQVTLRTQRHSVSLAASDGGVHAAALDAQVLSCERFYLAVTSTLADAEVGERLPGLVKAASQRDLQSLLVASTPGLRFKWAPSPPSDLATRDGEVCFAVDTASEYWSRVVDARDIAVYLAQPFDPSTTRMRLIGLPHSGGTT